jgi:LCP family protein required for cell wall assembly
MGRRLAGLAMVILLVIVGILTWRLATFLRTFNVGNPLAEAINQLNPPAGSVGWKVQNGKQVNLLLMGYGGAENDAPYLTDTMMVVEIDPASHRLVEASIPRDLQVGIQAFANGQTYDNKINTAYEVGMYDNYWHGKKPQYTGIKDRGGNLAMDTVSQVTGIHFDGYMALDFKAFRQVVDALGGVDVCLPSALDDNQYPNYHDGYMANGIHFKAGCQHVNGEQALELARSRHAVQAGEASDFARVKRQQLLLNAIRKKATSIDAITRAGPLMDALQQDFSTDLTLTDLRIIYGWSKQVSDSSIGRVAVDTSNLVFVCGNYILCPLDQTYGMMHWYFGHLLVDPRAVHEKAPLQIGNASLTLDQMGPQVTAVLQPLGFQTQAPVRLPARQQSVLYDYSGGKYPAETRWLSSVFNAQVVTPPRGTAAPTPDPPAGGLVLVLGRDFSLRWVGQAG